MKVIFDWLDRIRKRKEIVIKSLPSQGIFYNADFRLWIKKASVEDILEYEKLYTNDIAVVLSLVKNIVRKYTTMPSKYTFEDIKSIDVVFIFLQIVSYSQNKTIKIEYYNDVTGKQEFVDFTPDKFNYFNLTDLLKDSFNIDTKEFTIEGYRYSIPSIGIETSLTHYLIEKSQAPNSQIYNTYDYNFMYFLGNKKLLTFSEIDNLIEIFNNDMDDSEKARINNIIERFKGFSKYSVKNNNKVVEINNKIDLGSIWK
jgi:hypothetical protein